MDKEVVKKRIKEVIIEVLQDENLKIEDIKDEDSFFGKEEKPGIIQDSLLILEVASILSDEFDVDPEEFNDATFVNVEILSDMIMKKMKK